ncbi:SpoIIE family protein phosphatase [candidate division KSB1 bacterium]|nr:SpoIIE family protein phosphatase [candidate division KSB1 bacterium]
MVKAETFLESIDFETNRFNKLMTMRRDYPVIRYLQMRYDRDAIQELYGGDFEYLNYWRLEYFLDLPRNIPQESYILSLTPAGRIFEFYHVLPDTASGAHLDTETARAKSELFLRDWIKIDLSEYIEVKSSSDILKNRTDHFFTWEEREPRYKEGKFIIDVSIKGDEISGYHRFFEIPPPELKKFQHTESISSIVSILSFILSFIILIVITGIFLKKYHVGEIGVKNGIILLSFIVVLGIIETFMNIEIWSDNVVIGSMSRSQVVLSMTFVFIVFVYLFQALMSATGWAVGESYSRELWPEKLSSIDGIFKGNMLTTNAAASITSGYLSAFILLGLLTGIIYISVTYFNGWTTSSYPLRFIDRPMIFLVIMISGLLTGIINNIVYRLFFISIFKRLLKSSVIAIIISALIYMIQPQELSLFPVSVNLFTSFIIGLFLGIIFVQYDILTTIVTSFVFINFLSGVSLLQLESSYFKQHGYILLGILVLPLIVAAIGFVKNRVFTYQGDEVPAHVRRISERARLIRELEIARRVQMSLLPKTEPTIPGFQIAGICLPAQEVGGDYYDFVSVNQTKTGIVIGDVSGKGVPAAIYMTLTKGIMQSYAEENTSPLKVLSKVNKLMYKSIEKDTFVSMFYAILDHRNKTLTYARAGHNPAILLKGNNNSCQLLESKGIGLGLEKGVIFDQTIREETLSLGKGDILVLYTDGFTEAMNSSLVEYGEDKFLKIIESNSNLSASELIDKILHDIKRYVKGHPQHDDMTMVIIKANE